MAHYEIAHACGHTVRIDLVGPRSSREWRLERLRAELCRDCWRAQELASAQAVATAAGLPPFTAGTPAQRDWAEKLRVALLDRLESAYQQQRAAVALGERVALTTEQAKQVAALYAAGRAALIEERTDAKWWIDHREAADRALLRLALAQGIAVRPDLAPPELRSPTAPAAPSPTEPATPPAYILRPDTPLSQTLATVVYEPDTDRLVVRFPEYQERLREVMRAMDFTWTAPDWTRRLADLPESERTAQDRLAETATRLVAAGFVVRLRDADASARAQSGAFQPERRRWVRATLQHERYAGWLALRWAASDDLYAAALRLRGARWDKAAHCMRVPPGSADEIEEFARAYDFALSAPARALLTEIREGLAHGVVLSAPKRRSQRRRISGDGGVPMSVVPPRLPVPDLVEVADDLRDDD